jgi:tripartite-type tricarboxylate transporter receptor subunit TctC
VISTAVPHVQSGKVRAIAVTGSKRAGTLPDVPTVAETGVKGYLALNWYGMVAPANTPANVINRLNRDIVSTLKNPEVIRQLNARGIDAAPSTAAEYRAFAESERKRWLPVIKAAKIQTN